MQPAAAPDVAMGTPVTVMGLEIGHIPDPEIAKLTRKVIHISVVLALFALLNMIAALVGDPSKGGEHRSMGEKRVP